MVEILDVYFRFGETTSPMYSSETDRKKSPELPTEEKAAKETFGRLQRIEQVARCMHSSPDFDSGGQSREYSFNQNGLDISITYVKAQQQEQSMGMSDTNRVVIEAERYQPFSERVSEREGTKDKRIKVHMEFVRDKGFKLTIDDILVWEKDAFLMPETHTQVLQMLQLVVVALENKQVEHICAAVEEEKERQRGSIASVCAACESFQAAAEPQEKE